MSARSTGTINLPVWKVLACIYSLVLWSWVRIPQILTPRETWYKLRFEMFVLCTFFYSDSGVQKKERMNCVHSAIYQSAAKFVINFFHKPKLCDGVTCRRNLVTFRWTYFLFSSSNQLILFYDISVYIKRNHLSVCLILLYFYQIYNIIRYLYKSTIN